MIAQLVVYVLRASELIPVTFAQRPGGTNSTPTKPGGANPSGNTTVETIKLFDPLGIDGSPEGIASFINKFIAQLTILAIPVVTVLIVIGAIKIIVSGAKPNERESGKQYILWAVIGFALLLLATSITAVIKDLLQ